MTAPDLPTFLLARIAEDEDEIGPASDCDCDVIGLPLRHGVRCPVPMLAHCDAKRRIAEGCAWVLPPEVDLLPRLLGEQVLRDLVRPYADHPEFDPDWRQGVTP